MYYYGVFGGKDTHTRTRVCEQQNYARARRLWKNETVYSECQKEIEKSVNGSANDVEKLMVDCVNVRVAVQAGCQRCVAL